MKGRGGVYERGGVWYIRFIWKGKRFRESTGSDRKSDAAALLSKRLREAQDGTYRPDVASPTVKALAEKWLAVYVATSRNEKGKTLANYRVEHYLVPFMGDVRAEKVTKDMLRGYRLHLEGLLTEAEEEKKKKRLLSDQTVAHILSDARCLLVWAHDSGRIRHLPVPRKLLPKIPEREPRGMSREEQTRVASLPGPHGLACRIMLGTGVRWSELCRLTSADVSGGEVVVQGETKSRKMRRVPVPPALLRELRSHVGKLVPYEQGENPTFCRSVQRRSGVGDFTAHRLRHSFALNYLEDGGNLRVLQMLMGHASLETTEIYLKIGQQTARDDARKVMGWSPTA